jgi:predicted aconitase
MGLTQDQQAILDGCEGVVMSNCLRTLVEYADDDLYERIPDGATVKVDGDRQEIRVAG